MNEIGVFGLMMVYQRCRIAVSIIASSRFEAASWRDHTPFRRVIAPFRIATGKDCDSMHRA